MVDPDRVRLLFGPYQAPPLKRGDRAFCLVRDYPVRVIGWSDARISWPRCLPLDPPRRGRGLLIEDELARAVRHESAAAVAHWWGVHLSTVLNWRKALGVTRSNNEGSRRLVLGAVQASLDARFGQAGGSGRRRRRGAAGTRAGVWTAAELALVGALPDAEVARRLGRTPQAVAKKRAALGRQAVHAAR